MSTKNTSTKTVLVICVGCIILFLVSDKSWILYSGLGVGLAGLVSSKLADLIDYLWMKLATLLSFIIPNILLSTVFYLVLFPIAILSRIFRKKEVLRLVNNEDTFWQIKDSSANDKSSFEKMW